MFKPAQGSQCDSESSWDYPLLASCVIWYWNIHGKFIICQSAYCKKKAPGLLQCLLNPPDRGIGKYSYQLDFYIVRSWAGNDGIWTIICRFSKQAHFILVRKNKTLKQTANIFIYNIFKYNGMCLTQFFIGQLFHVMVNIKAHGRFVKKFPTGKRHQDCCSICKSQI